MTEADRIAEAKNLITEAMQLAWGAGRASVRRGRTLGDMPSFDAQIEPIITALSRTPQSKGGEGLTYLESEARRFADFYPEASDGRNTFVIFADKIAALANQDQPK